MRELLVSETAETVIRRAAATVHPAETGGILIGVWAKNRPWVWARSCPWVTHAPEIPSIERGPAHYVLPAGTTHPLVAYMHSVDSRLGYLGEWHVHPADVGPSPTDESTMRALAGVAGSAGRHPVLLVARWQKGTYVLDARECRRGTLRELTIVRAGSLVSRAV